VKDGYYLVVFHDEDELKAVRSVTRIARDMTKGHALRLKVVKVDATIDKPSASRARRGPDWLGDIELGDVDFGNVNLGSDWDAL